MDHCHLPKIFVYNNINNIYFSGYGAKRDQIDGSWFVQKLCKVIRGNAWKFDLDSMMKMVISY